MSQLPSSGWPAREWVSRPEHPSTSCRVGVATYASRLVLWLTATRSWRRSWPPRRTPAPGLHGPASGQSDEQTQQVFRLETGQGWNLNSPNGFWDCDQMWHGNRRYSGRHRGGNAWRRVLDLSLIHISEPTRLGMISYAVFCLK